MTLTLKPGVSLWAMEPQLCLAAQALAGVVAQTFGASADLRITSCADGEHREGSYHFEGLAFDFSCHAFVGAPRGEVFKAMAQALGGSGEARETTRTEPLPAALPDPSGRQQQRTIRDVAYAAGEFDLLHEDVGGPNEHGHLEWDRKRAERARALPKPSVA